MATRGGWCLRAHPEEGTLSEEEGAPGRDLWGQPSAKQWSGLGIQTQGEKHVKREVKYKISAMPEGCCANLEQGHVT